MEKPRVFYGIRKYHSIWRENFIGQQ